MNGLDLFSGIGGISLALREWVRPIAYCESDRYCQSVLLSRMQSGDIASAPICDDVRSLRGESVGKIDIIFGGFPCQDISVAGNGAGLGGERSGLFQHIARLVKETNPRFVFLENVPAIRTRGLNSVVQTFTDLGYDCRWTIVSAAEVGACHIRKRWFLLAHANGEALRKQSRRSEWKNGKSPAFNSSNGISRDIVESSARTFKPRVSRAGDGIPFAVDRDRALGNSVVPRQARKAFMKLMGIDSPQKGQSDD